MFFRPKMHQSQRGADLRILQCREPVACGIRRQGAEVRPHRLNEKNVGQMIHDTLRPRPWAGEFVNQKSHGVFQPRHRPALFAAHVDDRRQDRQQRIVLLIAEEKRAVEKSRWRSATAVAKADSLFDVLAAN